MGCSDTGSRPLTPNLGLAKVCSKQQRARGIIKGEGWERKSTEKYYPEKCTFEAK